MSEAPLARGAQRPLRQVMLVTGKGGVGKTSAAAGFARAEVQRGRKAVLVEFSDSESGTRVLGKGSGVEQVVIRPEEAIQSMSTDLLKSAILAKVVTGNFAMKRLFRAAPALRELAQLEAVRTIAADRPGVRVVVDMPATGHGVAWLRVAEQLRGLLRAGPLFRVAERLTEELVNDERCSAVIVTLPEPLVLKETLELEAALKEEVGLTAARLIVNRVPPKMPASAGSEADRLSRTPGEVGAAGAVLAALIRTRQKARDSALRILSELDAGRDDTSTAVVLPLAPADPSADEVAAWLDAGGAL
ncbi:MAG: ArsA-related P-loop ATPase [Myxococcota bacterium]